MVSENITQLVEKYNSNRDAYLKSSYNETQLRADFLDPLFELLGWDIKNSYGVATNEREVLLEEPLRENAGSNTKKPDYTFRLFSTRKFFLEAKKPSVRIDTDAVSAKQVRRYGFTAKLKVSILSNFEYLTVYDCSSPVNENDTSATSRIRTYHYTEYESEFNSIKELIGKESVYSGAFDETWSSIEDKINRSSVDDLFLQQINGWRLSLGSEIHKYAVDYHGTLISSGGTAGYCMITLPNDLPYSIYYIQALLSSKYLEWFSSLVGEVFKGGYIARGTKVLKELPIRIIDFTDAIDKQTHDSISKQQKALIQLQGKMDVQIWNNRKLIPLQRRFDLLKADLDASIQNLYSLEEGDSLIPLVSQIYATH